MYTLYKYRQRYKDGSLFNPASLNLTFSLLPITSSHPHASAPDSTFDFWRYVNIWLTLALRLTQFEHAEVNYSVSACVLKPNFTACIGR